MKQRLCNHLLLWSAVTVAGCASGADLSQLQQNQFAVRQMIANDRQQIDELREEVAQLNDRLTRLQHEDGTARPGPLNARLTAVNRRLTKLEQQVKALGAPAAGAVGPSAAENPPAAPVAALAPPPKPAAPAPSGLPNWREKLANELSAGVSRSTPGAALYLQGLAALRNRHYNAGIVRLAQLRHTFPKSPLVEPAEYFSANALYELGKYQQAVLQFNDLALRFPGGRFAGAALLREAQAFLKLHDEIDARLTLQKLVKDKPHTAEAAAADRMMKNLVSE